MKLFILSLCMFLSYSFVSCASMAPDLNLTTMMRGLYQEVKTKGCNANICFTIDGSGAVGYHEFKAATAFVQDVVNVLAGDPHAKFAANTFGRIAYPISGLTKDRFSFAGAMEHARYLGHYDSAVGAGIVACDFTLAYSKGNANKIVVISDGRNDFGGNPIARAKNFKYRDGTGKVSAVVVGYVADILTLKKISDTPVLQVHEYIQLGLYVKKLVHFVCGYGY